MLAELVEAVLVVLRKVLVVETVVTTLPLIVPPGTVVVCKDEVDGTVVGITVVEVVPIDPCEL